MELIKSGAPSFLVMCEPKDPEALPRQIKSFDAEHVRAGGEIVERHGDHWIEVLEPIPVGELPTFAIGDRSFMEIPSGSLYYGGAVERVLANRFERNRGAREECIKHYGKTCFLCSFDFVSFYGDIMAGFVHVHHLQPVASVGPDY